MFIILKFFSFCTKLRVRRKVVSRMNSHLLAARVAFTSTLFLLGFIGTVSLPVVASGFDRLSIEDGLSQASPQALYQDSKGFIWIGTRDGLNRFDGYRFEIFRHDPDDPDTISGEAITSLHSDIDGTLWVGAVGGLFAMYGQ